MLNGNDITKEEYYDLINRFTGAILYWFVKPEIITSPDL